MISGYIICIISPQHFEHPAVADPGFPRRGAKPKGGAQTYHIDHFCPKTAWN